MRNRHFLFVDALLLAGLPAVATALRFESVTFTPDIARALVCYSVIVLPVRLGIARWFGLYRCLWRHASLHEVQRIFTAGAACAVASFFIGTVGITATGLSTARLPYIALALDAVLAFGVFAGTRIAVRFAARRVRSASDRRALIVGAGAGGQSILREARVNPRLNLHVVGFVDDDPEKSKKLLGGVPVVGTIDELPDLISRFGASELVIAMPNARGTVVRRIMRAAGNAGIATSTMPAMHDVISGKVKVSSLRSVEIEDLLRREPIVIDRDSVRTLAAGQTVLITGAGGSIGSELCRQLAALEPAILIALDHSENQVFEISGELRRSFPKLRVIPLIADIRDTSRIHTLLGRLRPHAVFHAAAHKHVPLMEENVVEAITNNILGTRNVVDAALDAETRHLVNISTDKAVRPTSIMGATKWVAERLVAAAAATESRNFVSVRFGNVLGSRGSVIPTFLKQIKEGGPVTVTHRDMNRYFMTIPEAVQLVLQAGALGSGGELFVLDMGEPVKIVDLARDLIRLSGLEEGEDIEIVYTGVRPGEKLYEEVLFGGEEIRSTNHPKVLRATDDATDPELPARVDALIRRAVTYATDEAELRDMLRGLVPGYARADARTDPRTRPSPYPVPAPTVARPLLSK